MQRPVMIPQSSTRSFNCSCSTEILVVWLVVQRATVHEVSVCVYGAHELHCMGGYAGDLVPNLLQTYETYQQVQ